jgi:hypothetical protein
MVSKEIKAGNVRLRCGDVHAEAIEHEGIVRGGRKCCDLVATCKCEERSRTVQ